MVHQYKLNGYNIVLDTCSGSVHTVDEVAYDIIAMYKESTPEEIVKVIMERYGTLPDVNEDEILACIEDIKALEAFNHVYQVNHMDGKLVIKCSGGKHNLIKIMDYIRQKDISCTRVYSELPTLNDVFLEITGKELRDEEV